MEPEGAIAETLGKRMESFFLIGQSWSLQTGPSVPEGLFAGDESGLVMRGQKVYSSGKNEHNTTYPFGLVGHSV
jgi:hypothetical protein